MDICVNEVSYIHLGWFSVYIVLRDSSVCTGFHKLDKKYKEIKNHPDFIRINNCTLINYHDIDMINHSQVCLCSGGVFELGFLYRKSAVDKYMEKTLREMER